MRATIDVANDVLAAAKERAPSAVREPEPIYGVQPFASRGAVVTNDLIDRLRQHDAY